MRTICSLGLLASLVFVTGEARPCGGAFGSNYTIQPAQKIVVGYRNGVETYVFNPNFCGQADSFGLILPVPSTLVAQPTLGTQQLYTDLATVAAPTVVTTTQCMGKSGNGLGGGSSGVGGSAGVPSGTTVIQTGQVGIFDWALLKATSVSSFTQWLTTNGFPYQPTAVATFQSYVDNNWYFVAFKVSPRASSSSGTGGAASAGAGPAAGAPGAPTPTLCGSFGPVSLSFSVTSNPVIPARIASVSSSSLSWDVFVVAAQRMRFQSISSPTLFAGPISASDLASHPTLAAVAQTGDKLTELLLGTTPSSDVMIEPDPVQTDYRRVLNQVQYVVCSGGATSGGASTGGIGNGGKAGMSGSAGITNGGTGNAFGRGGAGAESPVSLGGSVVSNGGSVVSNGGSVVSNGGSVVSNGGSVVSNGGSVVSNGGSVVSNGGSVGSSGAAPLTDGGTTLGAAGAASHAGTPSTIPKPGDTEPEPESHDGCSVKPRGAGGLPGGMLLAGLAMVVALRRRLHQRERPQRG